MNNAIEILDEVVFFTSLKSLEHDESMPFAEDKPLDEFIAFNMARAMQKGVSDRKIKSVIKKASDRARDHYLAKILFECRKKVETDEGLCL